MIQTDDDVLPQPLRAQLNTLLLRHRTTVNERLCAPVLTDVLLEDRVPSLHPPAYRSQTVATQTVDSERVAGWSDAQVDAVAVRVLAAVTPALCRLIHQRIHYYRHGEMPRTMVTRDDAFSIYPAELWNAIDMHVQSQIADA